MKPDFMFLIFSFPNDIFALTFRSCGINWQHCFNQRPGSQSTKEPMVFMCCLINLIPVLNCTCKVWWKIIEVWNNAVLALTNARLRIGHIRGLPFIFRDLATLVLKSANRYLYCKARYFLGYDIRTLERFDVRALLVLFTVT